jgi:threonine/homoserine/homoserine lactone efflux protein
MTLDLPLALRGIVLGFSVAAPVGPIGVLVIRRSLAEGRAAGLATGLGAAAADGLYGCIAALGLTAVSALLVEQRALLQLVGGVALLVMGVRIVRSPPPMPAAGGEAVRGHLWRAFGSTFLLTVTNPVTILVFTAMFAALGLGAATAGAGAALMFVAGVVAGSAAWWLLLSAGVSAFRHAAGPGTLRWVNRISGAVVVGFGLVALATFGK